MKKSEVKKEYPFPGEEWKEKFEALKLFLVDMLVKNYDLRDVATRVYLLTRLKKI